MSNGNIEHGVTSNPEPYTEDKVREMRGQYPSSWMKMVLFAIVAACVLGAILYGLNNVHVMSEQEKLHTLPPQPKI